MIKTSGEKPVNAGEGHIDDERITLIFLSLSDTGFVHYALRISKHFSYFFHLMKSKTKYSTGQTWLKSEKKCYENDDFWN